MIAYPWDVLYVGVMLVLSASLLMGRHFLLMPLQSHYPKAPTYVSTVMFFSATVLTFLGIRFIWAFASGKPQQLPADPSWQLMATILVIHNGVMLANIIRQRYPEATWDRLNKINERLLCSNGMGIKSWFARNS